MDEALLKVRTVTCFVSLFRADFCESSSSASSSSDGLQGKLDEAVRVGRSVEAALIAQGYEVQTVRIATNPFPDWMDVSHETVALQQLQRIDSILQQHEIEFCALGPAMQADQLSLCLQIVQASHRFSCCASLKATDVEMAAAIADCILQSSMLQSTAPHLAQGLGNFRFCSTTSKAYIPFFPAARAEGATVDGDHLKKVGFAIGLENGSLAHHLLQQCQSIRNLNVFQREYARAILPIQAICQQVAAKLQSVKEQQLRQVEYLGIDTSLNPSLEGTKGSVAQALETLDEVQVFGGPGSLAAAAAITKAIQSLPDVMLTGYCGLMLPLCEDTRLAELSASETTPLTISSLLSISHVCGVGIDTVPIPGDTSSEDLMALLLDVAAMADRWDKSLSSRVFPVPGKRAGDATDFESPYMVNASVLALR
jgi:uncharacterized protein (UPF0210 family)